jgi:hypothetical protein
MRIEHKESYLTWFYPSVFVISVVAVIGSFWLGVHAWNDRFPDARLQVCKPLSSWVKWKIGVLLGWTVIPPCWFWIEYFGIYTEKKPGDFDRFKYGQDISSKVWLAVSTALLILYFGKDIHII